MNRRLLLLAVCVLLAAPVPRFAPPTAEADAPGFEVTIDLAYLDGHLWVATYNGFLDIETRTGRAVHYLPDPADPAAPDYGYVLVVYPERALFGGERLDACLGPANGSTPAEVVRCVLRALEGFTGGAPPADDVTMLALRYQG